MTPSEEPSQTTLAGGQSPTEPARVEGPRISDFVGLVVGFSLASLLARAFLPVDVRARDFFFLGSCVVLYLWLGVAMSGPLILTLDRWRRNAVDPDAPEKPTPARHSRAELSWLLIGSYWIVMTPFLAADRMPGIYWPLLYLFPGMGALLSAIGSLLRRPERVTPLTAWTHRTAVGLLITWPVAWILLIVISFSL